MRINKNQNKLHFKSLSMLSRPLGMFYNPNATIPTFIIESGVTSGRAYSANKKGGKIEASERLVEQGTSAVVWIWGVQMLQKLGEAIGKKVLKRDDFNFDIGFDYLRNPLENLNKTALKFKAVNLLLSTALATLFIGFGLPKINHYITKKIMKKDKERQKETNIKTISFEEFKNKAKNISFTSSLYNFANILENNSAMRLLITDTGVVGGRFYNARNKYEKAECLFRDISSIYFYLFSTQHIVKLLNKLTSNTDIDPKVLNETVEMLKERLEKSNLTDVHNFKNKAIGRANLANLREIDKLFKDKKVITLDEFKQAISGFNKKAELISKLQPELGGKLVLSKSQAQDIVKSGWISDSQFLHSVMKSATNGAYKQKNRFVSAKKVDKIRQSVEDFVLQVERKAKKQNCPIDSSFVEKVAKNNVRKNFAFYAIGTAVSIYALGFLIPKIQYLIRRKLTNSDEFVGIKENNK